MTAAVATMARRAEPAETSVAQVMSAAVFTTRPEERLIEVARTLREQHISGLPVLGEKGRLVGVVSESDLYRTLRASTGLASLRGLLDLLLGSAPPGGADPLELGRRRLARARVTEVMSSPAITVASDASLELAARRMRRARVNRLPVIDRAGRLVGIVTRADLVGGLSEGAPRRHGRLKPRYPDRSGPRRGADPLRDI